MPRITTVKSVSRSRWPDGNFKHLDSVREDGFEVRTSSLSEVARSRVRSPWQDAKQPRAQACIGQELLAVNGDDDARSGIIRRRFISRLVLTTTIIGTSPEIRSPGCVMETRDDDARYEGTLAGGGRSLDRWSKSRRSAEDLRRIRSLRREVRSDFCNWFSAITSSPGVVEGGVMRSG